MSIKKGQEGRKVKIANADRERLHKEFQHYLTSVKDKPELFHAPDAQYFREFVSKVERYPDKSKYLDRDNTLWLPVIAGPDVTKGYVMTLAKQRSGAEVSDHPILSVYSCNTSFRINALSAVSNKQAIKLTEIRLVDGNGHQIHCRLTLHLADCGRALERDDKLHLDQFTPLSFQINANTHRMPALFIVQMSHVGHLALLNDMVCDELLVCNSTSETAENQAALLGAPDHDGLDPRATTPPVCTNEIRVCARYRVRFIGCVCDVLPVGQRDLATRKEDCYFAMDDLDKMTPSHKRNMLFWWYATNVYNISGKSKRGKLLECLEYAIRLEHPNPDGVRYKGYRGK